MSNRLFLLCGAVLAATVLAGCSGAGDSSATAYQEKAAASVEEIPVTTSSDEARKLFEQGRHALDVGRDHDARELLGQAVEKDPKFTLAYTTLLDAANSPSMFMKNLEAAEALMDNASEGDKLLIQIARTFVDVDVAGRAQLSQQLVAAYPNSPRSLIRLSEVQAELKKTDEARATLKKALELDPDFVLTNRILGFAYMFNEPKDFAQAERYMGRVVELEPMEAGAHVDLGDVYRAQNRLEQARDSYSKGAELDPSSGLAFSKKGHADCFLGNYDAAREDFSKAVEVGVDQQKVFYADFKATTLAYKGDHKAALDELEKVYKSIESMGLPDDQKMTARIGSLTAQARIALHFGDLKVAKRALTRRDDQLRAQAKVVGDEDFTRSQEADIAWWDGELAARSGNYKAAMAKADEVAKLVEPETDPNKMEGYHSLMGLTYLLQGNHDKAVEHYRQADQDSFWVKHHLALALEGQGDTDEAKKLFHEVANWNFNSAAYACVRAEALKKASG